jgi:hypothetical protein
LSKLWFSPMTMMTCWMGVSVCGVPLPLTGGETGGEEKLLPPHPASVKHKAKLISTDTQPPRFCNFICSPVRPINKAAGL